MQEPKVNRNWTMTCPILASLCNLCVRRVSVVDLSFKKDPTQRHREHKASTESSIRTLDWTMPAIVLCYDATAGRIRQQ